MLLTKKKSKLFKVIWLSLLVALTAVVAYNVWDNNRVIVIEQDVAIQHLPDSFKGYKILLMSDLHSKRFGDHQADLLSLINNLDYEAIFIAGDMEAIKNGEYEPLLEILRGVEHNLAIYYVAGNWGPFDFDPVTGDILDAGKVLQAEGVHLMTLPVRIEKGGDHIWFVPEFSYSKNARLLQTASQNLHPLVNGEKPPYSTRTFEYQFQLLQAIKAIPADEVLIGLTHIPLAKSALDDLSDAPPYDLILAGHYHGGQIRLPLIRALYVPDHQSFQDSFFPDNSYISGLYVGQDTQQYISRGLGATGFAWLLRFRLFNTPEINLITLKSAESQ